MMHGIWELSPKFSDNTKYDKNSEAGAHHFWGTSWGISSGQINSRDRFTIFLRRCWSSGSHVSLFLCFCCTPKKTYPLVNEYITMERSTMLILYIPTLSGVVLFMGKFTKFQWWIVPVRYPFTRPGTSSPQPPGNRSERYPATDMAVPWARPKSGGWPSESSEPGQLPGQLPGWSRLDEIPIVLLLELPWLEETPIVFVGKNSNSELLHAGEILVFPLRLLLNTLNSRCKTCLNSHSCLVKTLVASPCFHQKISPKHRRRTDRRHVVHATSKCGGEHSNTLGEGDDDHSH